VTKQCLGVSEPADDAQAALFDCTDTSAHLDWTYTYPGDNLSIKLTGTTLYFLLLSIIPSYWYTPPRSCLDAGTNPHDNGPGKVYTCYPGITAQHWYYTADQRLALTGGTQCLDLDLTRYDKAVQTYTCTTGNTHQIWSPAPAPPTTTMTPPPAPTQETVQEIHPNGDASTCIVYRGVYDGAYVTSGACGNSTNPSAFFIGQGENKGVYVPGTNLCALHLCIRVNITHSRLW
jgi:hypothetical protein